MFSSERPDAPDAVILITDGMSKFPTVTRKQAELAKREDITIFSIGVGNETDINELLAIASEGDFLFQVEDYERLLGLVNVVAQRACAGMFTTVFPVLFFWKLLNRINFITMEIQVTQQLNEDLSRWRGSYQFL